MTVASVLVLAAAIGIAALSLQGGRGTALPSVPGAAPSGPVARARYDARAFLDRYVDGDGRVVRRDQGGDTVSEGQGYAMLLAVAVGDGRTFARVWAWTEANLQHPDGLFSYHWANGSVVGSDPASDADLDTAWALVLGARRFHRPAYLDAARRIAQAVLGEETVESGGREVLVAGPWARYAPYTVDPSYLAPEAMAALARATGDDRWTTLQSDSADALAALESGGHLPPDWARVDPPDAALVPAGAPGTGEPPAYGLDAQRVPVWYAADCTAAGRDVAAADWPALEQAGLRGAALSYSLTGTARTRIVNPLGLVASAASADAAGQWRQAARLLQQADDQEDRYHTYYGDAWVALGRVLLDTTWLSPCPPSPGGAALSS